MTQTEVLIVGSGFGGIGTAVRLAPLGIEDYVILERADAVGGTWRDNTYPGCACDVQSHLYSFSFAPNPAWSRSYSPQPEIRAYLERCAERFGVLPHVRFREEFRSAEWDDAAQRWRVETSRGSWEARLLVMANGALSEPAIPAIPGLERFAGRLFHSARWDHDYPLAGRRVAVIGTGASTAQFVPRIQPLVERLHVFQRTPPWIMPRDDRPVGRVAHALFRRVPLAQRAVRAWIYAKREMLVPVFRHRAVARLAERVALRHLARAVPDPVLRAKLTPRYSMGCKRVIVSSDYLPALAQPNVEVVTAGIAEVRARAIVDAEGVERPVDAIILGTGFHPTDPPFAPHVRGRAGRTLEEEWAGSPQAYLGTTVAGFPNLFLLMGPNTGLGHSSVVYMIEAQIEHLARALQAMRARELGAIEPRAEAQAAFVAEVERRMRGTVWTAGGCASWYLDRTGRCSALWPDFSFRFRRRAARFEPRDYLARRMAEAPAPLAGAAR